MQKRRVNQYVKRRRILRQSSYHGRSSPFPVRLIAAVVCVLLGLVLIFVRILGMRFSGFLLLGIAVLLSLSWLLDVLSVTGKPWLLVRRIFYVVLSLGLAALCVCEIYAIRWGHRDESALPADAVIVLGAGVNGTEPSLSLQTRLNAALTYLESHPDIPAVLSGGQGYGEEITEAQCMYNWLTAHGIDSDRLVLEEEASNTKENLSFSKALLEERGVDVSTGTVALVTNGFHMARTELLANRQGYGATPSIPAKLPWLHLTVNYYLREAFAFPMTLIFH